MGETERILLSKEIENDSLLLREISEELIDRLREEGVNEDIIFDIHVGVEEALRNAMVHGNKIIPGKKVRINAHISGADVIISIEDEGEGFLPEAVPDPTLDENLLKEGGRGVYLIRHVMDDVRYEDGGRKVVMKKNLKVKTKK